MSSLIFQTPWLTPKKFGGWLYDKNNILYTHVYTLSYFWEDIEEKDFKYKYLLRFYTEPVDDCCEFFITSGSYVRYSRNGHDGGVTGWFEGLKDLIATHKRLYVVLWYK